MPVLHILQQQQQQQQKTMPILHQDSNRQTKNLDSVLLSFI